MELGLGLRAFYNNINNVHISFYRRPHNCGHKDANSHRNVRAAIISGNPGLGPLVLTLLLVITLTSPWVCGHVRAGLTGDWRGGKLENLIIAEESNCAVKTEMTF